MSSAIDRIQGCLVDPDGTVYQEGRAGGDDLEGDVLGARQAGMIGVTGRTGKYRPADEERIRAAADLVIDSLPLSD